MTPEADDAVTRVATLWLALMVAAMLGASLCGHRGALRAAELHHAATYCTARQ